MRRPSALARAAARSLAQIVETYLEAAVRGVHDDAHGDQDSGGVQVHACGGGGAGGACEHAGPARAAGQGRTGHVGRKAAVCCTPDEARGRASRPQALPAQGNAPVSAWVTAAPPSRSMAHTMQLVMMAA